jgi:hypothetical protein
MHTPPAPTQPLDSDRSARRWPGLCPLFWECAAALVVLVRVYAGDWASSIRRLARSTNRACPPPPPPVQSPPHSAPATASVISTSQRVRQLARLGVRPWHEQGRLGAGVKVAVLDSGFQGYRDHLGHALPSHVAVRSFRADGRLEARDSQHGILCGEVIHAIAPQADLLLANWEPDQPDSFLRAVRWAAEQGARIISCSMIMPTWSDCEGGGPVHAQLQQILAQGDVLMVAAAGNTAQRHWHGPCNRRGRDHYHAWAEDCIDNPLRPFGGERVSVELIWSPPQSRYELEVCDLDSGRVVVTGQAPPHHGNAACLAARFLPVDGERYSVRVRHRDGPSGRFHLVVLGGNLTYRSERSSLAFPGDGAAVVTVGAVDAEYGADAVQFVRPQLQSPQARPGRGRPLQQQLAQSQLRWHLGCRAAGSRAGGGVVVGPPDRPGRPGAADAASSRT